jgi:hypothetical protein
VVDPDPAIASLLEDAARLATAANEKLDEALAIAERNAEFNKDGSSRGAGADAPAKGGRAGGYVGETSNYEPGNVRWATSSEQNKNKPPRPRMSEEEWAERAEQRKETARRWRAG